MPVTRKTLSREQQVSNQGYQSLKMFGILGKHESRVIRSISSGTDFAEIPIEKMIV